MKYEYFKKKYWEDLLVYHCGIDQNLKPGIRYGPVIRDVFIIECCTWGAGSVIINNQEFPFRENMCYILMPGDTVIHTTDLEEPREGVWCAIDSVAFRNVCSRAGVSSDNPFAPPEAFPTITAEIENMLKMRNDIDPGADYRRAGCIYNIMGALLRTTGQNNKNVAIQKAIGIMETRYYEDLHVEEIARTVGFDRCYFSSLFKEKTGKTPHAYLTALRVQKAAALLTAGGTTVTEAATSVGIDPQNFARFFKTQTGKTPKQYVKERL